MARSRTPLSVSAGGASNSLRACASPSAGVLPSLPLAIGRLTPSTGLPKTALRSHRCSNSEDSAESLRRMLAGAIAPASRSLRQAITWARGDASEVGGLAEPGEGGKLAHV